MKKIQVLGTGCAKCKKLEENVALAIKNLGLDYEIEKITDIKDILNYGIMMTPGLGIEGKIVSSGRLLNVREIETILTTDNV